MDKDQITTWLNEENHSRQWLAAQIGCSKGTVDQWFSKGFPDWAVKSIDRLVNTPGAKDSGLSVEFTAAEFELIEKARQLSGHPTRSAFYHDAIIDYTDKIIAGEKEEPKPSAPTVKPGATPETAKIVHLSRPPVLAEQPPSIAAEGQGTGTGPKISAENTSYGSSLRRKKK